MSFSLSKPALSRFLKSHDDALYGKLVNLRDDIAAWLRYTPATFPHYTAHTVEHSDEIVTQLSNLLFAEGRKPRIALSPMEAYILLAAAYLHDAGMVASDAEKSVILASAEWQTWTTGTGAGGADRWRQIQELRAASSTPGEPVRHFIADLQTRFLIAEFIRRRHHYRAADVIRQYAPSLGSFAFNDAMLQGTIADVCIAHGLRHHELEDSTRYPDRRTIRGEQVNVRLLAILLRLGDLLDMSSDRACPLLLNAASPLPDDSYAHWTQYQRIKHFSVGPDQIEILAECLNQEEHTFLQDWCRWLVEETRNAAVTVARCRRHNEWKPPIAEIDGERPTILIRPAPEARYFPSRWTFELDRDLVLERFVHNVHQDALEFIRELLQNAFDATRCQLYSDLGAAGLPQPEYPPEAPTDILERYPIRVNLEWREFPTELSGGKESRQVLTIEDCGIGMDRKVVEHYFLQVGRSYYVTDEFRKAYRFVPTSRFGVGFLSVFSASDDVRVETYNPKSTDGPLKLRLRGAKSYILTERGDRTAAGTKVEVVLRTPLGPDTLPNTIQTWCRRVEFPIIIRESGHETTIRAETADRFTREWPDPGRTGSNFVVRAFPIREPGVFGEAYVTLYRTQGHDYWVDSREIEEYFERSATAFRGELPSNLVTFNGITSGTSANVSMNESCIFSLRIDHRSPRAANLSRQPAETDVAAIAYQDPRLLKRLEEILRAHLACTSTWPPSERLAYIHQLAYKLFFLQDCWDDVPDTVALQKGAKTRTASLESLAALPAIAFLVTFKNLPASLARARRSAQWAIPLRDGFPGPFFSRLCSGRVPTSVAPEGPHELRIEWTSGTAPEAPVGDYCMPFHPSLSVLGIALAGFPPHFSPEVLVNSNHRLMKWFVRAAEAGSLSEEHRQKLAGFISDSLTISPKGPELSQYLNSFRAVPGFPADLYPPELSATDFLHDDDEDVEPDFAAEDPDPAPTPQRSPKRVRSAPRRAATKSRS